MSEYQYYEFRSVDRSLTAKEMAELRSFSTRARITPTSFVNEYNWGNFKGDPDKWMAKYFDAFLYSANWGTHELKLSLPSGLLDLKTARQYCCSDNVFACEKNGKIILSFVSDDEEAEWDEDEGNLGALISVRSDLNRGDLRVLYLGWLFCAQRGEFDNEDEEPPVPPGLGQINASLDGFIDFLRIDRDLICVAARASAPLQDGNLKADEVKAWVAKLPSGEKNDVLTRLMVDNDPALIPVMLQQYLKDHIHSGRRTSESAARRTVGDLLRAANEYAEERRRIEAEKRAMEKARREREAAIAKEKRLDELVGRESQLWEKVHSLIATRKPTHYDLAVRIMGDLCELDKRTKSGDFGRHLDEVRRQHANKPALIRRLLEKKL
jgi:hypothetical protein